MATRRRELAAGTDTGKPRKRKNLRHNAREAQEYFNPPVFSYARPGRGQGGESSN